MSNSRSIPEELIKIKAYEIWKKRQREGRDGTPTSDWIEARKYLEESIKREAYLLWEADGKPVGKDNYYWTKAIEQIEIKKIPTIYKPYYWLGYWLEKRIFEPLYAWIEEQAFFKILLLIVTFLGGIPFAEYFIEDGKRNNDVFTAWQTITNAEGQSGSGGRIEALEYLNSRPFQFPWIGWTERDWYWDNIGQKCKRKRLLGRRWKRQPLAGLSAPEAYLVGIHLCGAFLRSVNLQQADLSSANLQQADLESANLQQADLESANLQQANLGGANLQETTLHNANLQRANLGGVNLQRARLWRANLQGAFLRWANLQKAMLREANLQQTSLLHASLQEAYLGRANLQQADLGRANLQQAHLSSVNLQQANLQLANLQQAYLGGANLQQANLSPANLQQANLRSANLQEADLEGANLRQAVLESAENLTPEQIKLACNWDKAIYKGEWNDEKKAWVAIEPDNTNYIEELKQETASDPKKPPDCSGLSTLI